MRIANAYELAARNNPSDVSFDREKMRKHLVQCLERAFLNLFRDSRTMLSKFCLIGHCKNCFVLMLLFDIGKVCRKNIHPKNKYFFASFNNDRRLSLEDRTKDYVEEIPSIYILNIFVT